MRLRVASCWEPRCEALQRLVDLICTGRERANRIDGAATFAWHLHSSVCHWPVNTFNSTETGNVPSRNEEIARTASGVAVTYYAILAPRCRLTEFTYLLLPFCRLLCGPDKKNYFCRSAMRVCLCEWLDDNFPLCDFCWYSAQRFIWIVPRSHS